MRSNRLLHHVAQEAAQLEPRVILDDKNGLTQSRRLSGFHSIRVND
ncbi:MAG: hypothetical protein RL597_1033, partial [Pseudomonadota bacterium]